MHSVAIIEIDSLERPELKVFTSLTDTRLRSSELSDDGIFIAESPKVIMTAIDCGYRPLSLLCEKKHITGDAACIIDRFKDLDVFTGSREILTGLTGYTLTRGVLCAMKRKRSAEAEKLLAGCQTVAMLHQVCDATNIGAIFRSAAALGIDAVLLTPGTCDPLNRRSIRVSMGAVFRMKWAFLDNPLKQLKRQGFKTIALALTETALPLDSTILKEIPKKALILGTEGDGLDKKTIEKSDFTAKIPMYNSVDSLNVGVAAAIAFWEFRRL